MNLDELLGNSPLEHLLVGLSETERGLITTQRIGDGAAPLPELRATVFPLVNILWMPFRFVFATIERILVVSISGVHTTVVGLAGLAWFCFQCYMYRTVENIFSAFFQSIEAAIFADFPDWLRPLFAGIPTAMAVAGLKAYWYGLNFWNCFLWIVAIRFSIVAVFVVISLVVMGISHLRG